MKNVIETNAVTALTDDDCNIVDGGLITCQQFVVGMTTIGGMAVGSAVPGLGTGVGGFAGGLVGLGLSELLCP